MTLAVTGLENRASVRARQSPPGIFRGDGAGADFCPDRFVPSSSVLTRNLGRTRGTFSGSRSNDVSFEGAVAGFCGAGCAPRSSGVRMNTGRTRGRSSKSNLGATLAAGPGFSSRSWGMVDIPPPTRCTASVLSGGHLSRLSVPMIALGMGPERLALAAGQCWSSVPAPVICVATRLSSNARAALTSAHGRRRGGAGNGRCGLSAHRFSQGAQQCLPP